MAKQRNIVTIGVSSLDESRQSLAAAFRGEQQGSHISFISDELLWQTLTLKRWEIVKAMTGQKPMAIREIARRIGRDVKAVHGDIQALVLSGVFDRTAEGKISFPYDEIRVDFAFRPQDAAA